MHVIHTIDELRRTLAQQRREGKTIGFVPTMGGLHEGHGSLIKQSTSECDCTVVSIFINALQFGPGEDFDAYPRNLDRDSEFCRERGVDIIFAPSHREMYPRDQRTFVDVESLTETLCGRSRPGHFRGVATVVTKLLMIVAPDRAYFGEKDGQQLVVVRRVVEDLNIPVMVRAVPTVREPDGLAMSTRNQYLTPEERQAALAIYRALTKARELLDGGERRADAIRQAVRECLDAQPLLMVDYVEVVDAESLQPVSYIDERIMVAVAAFVGKARLIDNMVYPSRGS